MACNHDGFENVLILQRGGSLGVFGCGVFKDLAKTKVKIDILTGTLIGRINVAIIAGSKDKRPDIHWNNSGLSLQKIQLILYRHCCFHQFPFLLLTMS